MNTRTEKLKRDFGGRIREFGNGQVGLVKEFPVEMEVDEAAHEITFTASTSALDRYNEVIDQSGWDLRNYLANPVFQDSHLYSPIDRTIGRSVETVVKGGRLVMRIRFATDVEDHKQARLAYQMYAKGYLNAVSVGFIPLEYVMGGKGDPYDRKFLKQELLELSAVAIPANPEALQQDTFQPQRSDSGDATATAQARDLAELLELTRKLNQP